jgi:hypothetical protein
MSRKAKLMSKTMRAVLNLGVGIALLTALPSVAGAQDRPWPDFAVTRAADGAAMRSTAIAHGERWLVVVVSPRCEPCRALLGRLSREGSASRPGRVAVVFSGVGAAEAAAMQAAAPRLPADAWYRDDAGVAVVALGAPAAPALFGMRGDRIAWTFGGFLYSDAQWQGVVVPWLR